MTVSQSINRHSVRHEATGMQIERGEIFEEHIETVGGVWTMGGRPAGWPAGFLEPQLLLL